jgi:hypothetical protein
VLNDLSLIDVTGARHAAAAGVRPSWVGLCLVWITLGFGTINVSFRRLLISDEVADKRRLAIRENG